MKFINLPRKAELDILNLICPTGRKHKDISTETFPDGRFEMTCHDCSQAAPMGEPIIYVNPNINY
jgi:hypothetical protein